MRAPHGGAICREAEADDVIDEGTPEGNESKLGSDSSDESSSKASSAKCDESASDATSSDEADEAETVCGECLDPLADDAPRFRDGADVHKECGQTVRAAKKKLSAKGPKVLKQFNKLKKTNPKEYSKTIKKLKKQRGKDGRLAGEAACKLVMKMEDLERRTTLRRTEDKLCLNLRMYSEEMFKQKSWGPERCKVQFKKLWKDVKHYSEYNTDKEKTVSVSLPSRLGHIEDLSCIRRPKDQKAITAGDASSMISGKSSIKGFSSMSPSHPEKIRFTSGHPLCYLLSYLITILV